MDNLGLQRFVTFSYGIHVYVCVIIYTVPKNVIKIKIEFDKSILTIENTQKQLKATRMGSLPHVKNTKA